MAPIRSDKTLTFWIVLLSLLADSCNQDDSYVQLPTSAAAASTGNKLTFYVSQNYLEIDVVVNGSLAGEITKIYSSAPSCGSSGCVTVTVTPNVQLSWYAASANRAWGNSANPNKYTPKTGCNVLKLN